MAVLGRVLFGLAPPPPAKWLGAALEGLSPLLPGPAAALVGRPRAILDLPLEAVPGLWRGIALPGRRIGATVSSSPPVICLLCLSLASMTQAGDDFGLASRLCGNTGELERRFGGR